jgi:hypothetical protein
LSIFGAAFGASCSGRPSRSAPGPSSHARARGTKGIRGERGSFTMHPHGPRNRLLRQDLRRFLKCVHRRSRLGNMGGEQQPKSPQSLARLGSLPLREADFRPERSRPQAPSRAVSANRCRTSARTAGIARFRRSKRRRWRSRETRFADHDPGPLAAPVFTHQNAARNCPRDATANAAGSHAPALGGQTPPPRVAATVSHAACRARTSE